MTTKSLQSFFAKPLSAATTTSAFTIPTAIDTPVTVYVTNTDFFAVNSYIYIVSSDNTQSGTFKVLSKTDYSLSVSLDSLLYKTGSGSVPSNAVVVASGIPGIPGTPGPDGVSAYQVWISLGNAGTEQQFIDSLKGADGVDGTNGAEGTNGVDGTDGLSAYQIWLSLGNTGTDQNFINSLKSYSIIDGAPNGIPITMPDIGLYFWAFISDRSWLSIGQPVFISDGSSYGVFTVNEFSGGGGNPTKFVNTWGLTTGSSINEGAKISPCGFPGVNGTNGTNGTDGTNGVDGVDGVDGSNIELQTTATHIQWRVVGGTWADLIALADLVGPEGPAGPSASSATLSENAQTGTTYTLALTDAGILVSMNNASANTLYIPHSSVVTFPADTQILLGQKGAGITTYTPDTDVYLNGLNESKVSSGQWDMVTLKMMGTDSWWIAGGII